MKITILEKVWESDSFRLRVKFEEDRVNITKDFNCMPYAVEEINRIIANEANRLSNVLSVYNEVTSDQFPNNYQYDKDTSKVYKHDISTNELFDLTTGEIYKPIIIDKSPAIKILGV